MAGPRDGQEYIKIKRITKYCVYKKEKKIQIPVSKNASYNFYITYDYIFCIFKNIDNTLLFNTISHLYNLDKNVLSVRILTVAHSSSSRYRFRDSWCFIYEKTEKDQRICTRATKYFFC